MEDHQLVTTRANTDPGQLERHLKFIDQVKQILIYVAHLLNPNGPLHVLELVLLPVDLKDTRFRNDNGSISHLIAVIEFAHEGREKDHLEMIYILHIVH